MLYLGIFIFFISFITLVIFLVKSSLRSTPAILSSAAIMVLAIGFVGVALYNERKLDQQKALTDQLMKLEQKALDEQTSKQKDIEKEDASDEQLSKQLAEEGQEASSEQLPAQSDTANTIDKVQQQLIGKKFSITPVTYDGIDADQAMKENKAPQNLIHDGVKVISFLDNTSAHVELLGTYRPDFDTSYALTGNELTVGQDTIPYSVANGIISFNSWSTDINGHTVVWSFTPSE